MMNHIQGKRNYTIGIISDTHGLLRPKAFSALQGSDLIIHAGDIGDLQIINSLETISTVVAVRGNMDNDIRAFHLKRTELVGVGSHRIYVVHDVCTLDIEPSSADIRVIIHGHSHRPAIQEYEGLLYINPGSAGPRRFKLPVTVALLHIKGKNLHAEIVDVQV
ncbi:MAG TPA: metallophosphoesterase [Nitrospiraceae bacterium]|nr:metallophosphoesterase [Nitrospiraceae bacterium]